MTSPRLVAAAAVLALAFAGCSGESDPVADDTPRPKAPAATPTDPLPTASDGATPTVTPTTAPSGDASEEPPPFPPTEGLSEGTDGGAADDTCLEGATECADDPGSGPPAPPEGTTVEPHPDLVEVEATPWESVSPVDAEQTVLEVQWFGGNEACFGLDRVELEETADAVSITVFTGREPGDQVCTMEAALKSTEVELSEPLGPRSILDGAEG